MAGKPKDVRIKRTYRHINATVGVRSHDRDGMNLTDVDKACEKWLRKHDPGYRKGVISSHYIDYYGCKSLFRR